MRTDATGTMVGVERPRTIIIVLIVWTLLQLPRLIAIPLIGDVLDDTESDAWMFPAILDVAVAVAAPFLAFALWRFRGLWVWTFAIVFFAISIVDHVDALIALELTPTPEVFGSGGNPSLFPGIGLVIDILAVWLLARPKVRHYYVAA